MNTGEFLTRLRELNVRLQVRDGELKISAPKGALTAELRDELLARKADLLALLSAAEPTADVEPIPRVPRDAPLALSFTQQRLWFLDQLEPGDTTYNMWVDWVLKGPVDIAALERSLAEIVRRHEVLRTTFESSDGVPRQVVHEPQFVPALERIENEAGIAADRWEAQVRERLSALIAQPMDLSRGPLFTARLVALDDERHLLFVLVHHIVFDGISIGVFARELFALYEAFSAGRPNPLSEPTIQFADFAHWQRDYMKGAVFERHMAYWRRVLRGPLPVLELPTDHARPAVQTHNGALVSREVPLDLYGRLEALAQDSGTTLFVPLLAGFKLFLSRYSGLTDVLVGTAIANRTSPEIEDLLGFFVNTLVLRTNLDGDATFKQLIERVRDGFLGALEHQDTPFEMLVDELAPERDLGRSPIFQAMFVLDQDTGESRVMRGASGAIEVEGFQLRNPVARTDLVLTAYRGRDKCYLTFEYNSDLFEAGTIERMIDQLAGVLGRLVEAPETPISKIALLASEERQRVVEASWTAASDYPRVGIHRQFEAWADRTPEATAVVFPTGASAEEVLSYAELERRANRLARHLEERGVQPGTLVGLGLERSADMLVALLAVLKCGAAYVPLDPAYPTERLAFMVEDAGLRVLVTSSDQAARLPSHGLEHVLLDREAEAIAARPSGRIDRAGELEDRMYVIFTSGSTGRPKGVEIAHRSVSNFLASMAREPGLAQGESLLALTTLSFDISVLELLLPLVVGARVIVAPRAATADGEELTRLLERYRPHVMQATPATWRMLLLAGWRGQESLRIFSGGEALTRELADELLARGAELWNLYGPTETTIWSAVERVQAGPETITIGRPIDTTALYVLDAALEPQPLGVPGELWIAGDGLALGYLERPELTDERFVVDPFGSGATRMYRTGDLARRLPDGRIECLGRVDNQVKLRGFRIELGEIDAVLEESARVHQCATIVREDRPGDARLVAYYTRAMDAPAVADGAADADELLRAEAGARLPAYMVPSSFVELEALPLTPNGKIDRRALSALEAVALQSRAAFVAPRDAIEQGLAQIWRAVLGIEDPSGVGIHDDFFALGGNSLLTTQAASRIREAFAVELPLRELFEKPTIAELAPRVACRSDSDQGESECALSAPGAIAPIEGDDPRPLSFTQDRLWFLDQLEPGLVAYNMQIGWALEGELDVEALERALSEIVRRHAILRTRFPDSGRGAIQEIGRADRVSIERVDLSAESDPEGRAGEHLSAWAEEPFDLARGPLFKPRLVRLGEGRHWLLVFLHHIVFDGWSGDLFRRELVVLYEAYSRGDASPLPELAIQFADYAAWQRAFLEGAELERLLSYWREKLGGDLPVLELPLDHPRPKVQTYGGANVERSVERSALQPLLDLAREEGATPYMALLAAYDVLLARYSGQDDVIVGSVVANRNRAEIEPLLGFFANTLALRTDLSGEPSFREVLRRVRDTVLGALDHQDMPFERLVDEIQPQRNMSHTPVFQTMFSMEDVQSSASPSQARMGEIEFGSIGMATTVARTDLMLWVAPGAERFLFWTEYNVDLFEHETIAGLLSSFEVLLRAIAQDPDRPISRLELVDGEERERVVRLWNATRRTYPQDSSLHAEFEGRVAEAPDAPAVRFRDTLLSYAELNRRANRVANLLRAKGVERESRVAMCVDRSLDMVVCVLGIVKAGAAYVPLDPVYPEERLRFMIEDTEASVLLTTSDLADELPATGEVICLDTQADELLAAGDENPPVISDAADLAYVVYTSGSTGRPKGVLIPQRAVLRLVFQSDFADLGPGKSILALSPISFDASTFDLWGALLRGGTTVVFPERVPSAEAMARALEQGQVTTLFVTTALFNSVVDELPEALRPVRQLMTGGEAMSLVHVQRCMAALPELELSNIYGPTESTTFSTVHPIDRDTSRYLGNVPIGKPIGNTTNYVLDPDCQPVPVGVPGELFIGGDGIADGYLNRPELTAERFLRDPFAGDPQARLYRTGDVVRWNRRGEIEYLARNDDQVKIRGHRIEPGEVQFLLAQAPAVRECIVIVREDQPGDKRLVAYVVAEDGPDESAATGKELRRFLKERLPSYMLPSAFVLMDTIPLNPNGKVERSALPVPEIGRADLEDEYVAPRTPLERDLVAIWCEVLGVQECGIEDSFFELGGNSLLTTRVMSEMKKRCGIDLPLRALFEEPTIAGLSSRVEPREGLPDTTGAADGAGATARSGANGVEKRRYSELFDACLIPMQPRGTRPPLFLVAGAHANEDDFLRFVGQLLPHMGSDQPIYGFKARGLDGRQEPHRSAEEMARDYLQELLEFRPEGPYLLAGNCVGGVVAFEMARLLHAQGHDVALTALLDTIMPSKEYVDYVDGHYSPFNRERLRAHLKNMRELGPTRMLTYAAEKVAGKLSRLMPLTEERRRANHIQMVEHQYSKVLARYQPAPYEGRVTLVTNEELWDLYGDMGWGEFARGGLDVRVVPGDHVTRLLENSAEAAGILRECIDEALEASLQR